MSIPTEPAAEHRSIAGTFAERVRGVAPEAWDNQAPVPEWTARDVVRHLHHWFPAFLADGADIKLPPGPSVDNDPVAAWEHHAGAVQEILDDPTTPGRTFAHPRLPETPLDRAISRFYTNDVFMHTWKLELTRLADETGLAITVCHFPPGTSKWNRIEHRLFAHISINWRGRPLTSHEVVVDLIGATTTRTGLTVHAEADTNSYPRGVKVTDAQMAAIQPQLKPHNFHGEWNYTIRPRTTRM